MTASVLTSVVPRPAISAATAASRSNPCSIESTPPSTASRAPLEPPRVGCHPGAARVHGLCHARDLVRRPRRYVHVRPVHVQLDEVGAGIQLADGGAEQLVRVAGLDRPVHRGHAGREQPAPGGAQVRSVERGPPIGLGRRWPGPARAHPPGRRRSASRRRASSARRRPAPIRPLCSAAASSASGGSLKRSIQFAPPGPVTWLWQSTMPGTNVAPELSMTVAPPESSSPPVGRIQAIRPSSTRMLTLR